MDTQMLYNGGIVCLFISGVSLIVFIVLAFAFDLSGAIALLRTQEAKVMLKDSKVRKQAKEIVKQFAASGQGTDPETASIDLDAFKTTIFDKPEESEIERWPVMRVKEVIPEKVAAYIALHFEKAAEIHVNGLYLLAGEEHYVFKKVS